MDESTRRKLKMGKRALEFARAAELEQAVELEQKQQRKPAEYGKVLPFRRRSKRGGPTEPAA